MNGHAGIAPANACLLLRRLVLVDVPRKILETYAHNGVSVKHLSGDRPELASKPTSTGHWIIRLVHNCGDSVPVRTWGAARHAQRQNQRDADGELLRG